MVQIKKLWKFGRNLIWTETNYTFTNLCWLESFGSNISDGVSDLCRETTGALRKLIHLEFMKVDQKAQIILCSGRTAMDFLFHKSSALMLNSRIFYCWARQWGCPINARVNCSFSCWGSGKEDILTDYLIPDRQRFPCSPVLMESSCLLRPV